MVFWITNDHPRQERVWDTIPPPHGRDPYCIRRQLTEATISAKGVQAAELNALVKEVDMAREAERLMTETGWFPETLGMIEVDECHSDSADSVEHDHSA
jgi:hypothetical protein